MIKNVKFPGKASVDVGKVIGKKVISKDNKVLGRVANVYMNPTKIEVGGIRLGPSKLLADVIEKKYVSSIGEKGIVLSISPVTDYEGMKVFDSEKREVGRVKKVRRDSGTGRISSFTVERGLLKKEMEFKKSAVVKVTGRIYLNRKV